MRDCYLIKEAIGCAFVKLICYTIVKNKCIHIDKNHTSLVFLCNNKLEKGSLSYL